MSQEEVTKLKRHLSLLREEYVKLQARLADLEKKYSVAVAAAGDVSEDTFVARLLKTVANLYDKELYSDLTILLDGKTVRAHRFVLSARSTSWGVTSLAEVDQLDLSDVPQDIGLAMLKWVYTDQIDLSSPDNFLLELMRVAKRFKLASLSERCEKALMSSVNVSNCVKFYETADEIEAEALKEHCSEIISCHWNDFTREDFAHMSAPLLYRMLKAKTSHPLHTAIRIQREDVVFLYLIEYDSQLPAKLNEVDESGDIPLDLALRTKQESIAKTLVANKASINATDNRGHSLLHLAIERGDEFAATFLIENHAGVDVAIPLSKEAPLHLVANFSPLQVNADVMEGIARVAGLLLKHSANPNIQDGSGNTPLHRAIASQNDLVFTQLLECSALNLELRNGDGDTALSYAVQTSKGSLSDNSFAGRLVKRGCCVDAINPLNGNSLLHSAAISGNEEAGIFLATHGAKTNLTNNKGETPLHMACANGLSNLVTVLLQKGANANLQTARLDPVAALSIEDDNEFVCQQTPLHLAVLGKHVDTIKAIIEHKSLTQHAGDSSFVVPNFNIKNSKDQTPLALALDLSYHEIATLLLSGGANVNITNVDGYTLLHQTILHQDTKGALFLLSNGADTTITTREGDTPLQLAVKRHLPAVVEALCKQGADLNVRDENGNSPLWVALESGQEDVASILVQYGCDPNCWREGPGGCYQTLLHRAIDDSNEPVACFLIRSGCDVDSARRPGPDGRGEEEAYDGQGPLHLSCAWSLEKVVQTLIEHNANVNAQDTEGKTPIHVAIANQSPAVISLLLSHPALNLTLRDKQGETPFAAAMTMRNNKAAEAILAREPTAAEQHDNKGRNFLHLAIQKSDFESVLFLLSIHVNINSRVQDSTQLTPLHLAVEAGSEMIVRNLLLAGSNINDVTPQNQTALHLAATHDHSTICSILLENGVDFNVVDTNLNNALHIACQKGHIATCRVLLTESRIDAQAFNLRGQSPFHVLCQYGKENAAAIYEQFMEAIPDYPINKPDAEGNTPLLLAYMNGNGNLCRAIVRDGASLGVCNRQGMNIFNYQVATKQLLFRLLDYLPNESEWTEGDSCLECGVKFSLKNRKHHCRHCGRILCSKCSSKEIPILKFKHTKPVRVCDTCYDVLTLGISS